MLQEAIRRIEQMEQHFDALQAMADANPGGLRKDGVFQDLLQTLIQYYEGGQWLQDYQLDENSLLPPDLKRGVLSEDGIYNLLAEIQER